MLLLNVLIWKWNYSTKNQKNRLSKICKNYKLKMIFINKESINLKKTKNLQISSVLIIISINLIKMNNNQIKHKRICNKDAFILKINCKLKKNNSKFMSKNMKV